MKTLTITIENAVLYRDDRQVLPYPTEHAIAELKDEDSVLFRVKDADGKILLELPILNYFELEGCVDGMAVISEMRNIRQQFLPNPEGRKWPWSKK